MSRRRLDAADFDPDEVDEDGLPLVYNEDRIALYWKGRPGELTSRWTKFAGISGGRGAGYRGEAKYKRWMDGLDM